MASIAQARLCVSAITGTMRLITSRIVWIVVTNARPASGLIRIAPLVMGSIGTAQICQIAAAIITASKSVKMKIAPYAERIARGAKILLTSAWSAMGPIGQ